eukprot:1912677-Prymnesium_polylepis.1
MLHAGMGWALGWECVAPPVLCQTAENRRAMSLAPPETGLPLGSSPPGGAEGEVMELEGGGAEMDQAALEAAAAQACEEAEAAEKRQKAQEAKKLKEEKARQIMACMKAKTQS